MQDINKILNIRLYKYERMMKSIIRIKVEFIKVIKSLNSHLHIVKPHKKKEHVG